MDRRMRRIRSIEKVRIRYPVLPLTKTGRNIRIASRITIETVSAERLILPNFSAGDRPSLCKSSFDSMNIFGDLSTSMEALYETHTTLETMFKAERLKMSGVFAFIVESFILLNEEERSKMPIVVFDAFIRSNELKKE
ncbi:MAG: hypothetical protein QXP42_03545 [Candidatus Micrarchaeia archaeon]